MKGSKILRKSSVSQKKKKNECSKSVEQHVNTRTSDGISSPTCNDPTDIFNSLETLRPDVPAQYELLSPPPPVVTNARGSTIVEEEDFECYT